MADVKAYLGNNPYIFVSYAHKSKDEVYPFIAALQEKYNVWFDDGIRYGQEWEMEIATKLSQCAVFIYMVTPESLASANCKDEIHLARELGKPFLNVLVKKDTQLPLEFTFRYGRYQMCNLFTFPSCREAVADLAKKFESLDATEKKPGDTGELQREHPPISVMPAIPFGQSNYGNLFEYKVTLVNYEKENKLNTIKTLCVLLRLGLFDAKKIVDYLPQVIKTHVSQNEAETLAKDLQEIGATVTIERMS